MFVNSHGDIWSSQIDISSNPIAWHCQGRRSSSFEPSVPLARAAFFRDRWHSGERLDEFIIAHVAKLVDCFLKRHLSLVILLVVILNFIEIFGENLAVFVLIGCVLKFLVVRVLNGRIFWYFIIVYNQHEFSP
jgi:hypothetical protein